MSMEQIAQDKQKWMTEHEAEYLRAKEYINSEQFKADKLKVVAKIRAAVKLGALNEGEAMQIVGRVQQILIDAFDFEHVILIYEDFKKKLNEAFPPK